jgi:hypothetical protein
VTEKTASVLRAVCFALLITFLLWFVDYRNLGLTGFDNDPKGYGSLAFQFIQLFDWEDLDGYDSRNSAWLVSQILPLLLALRLRNHLECVVRFCGRMFRNL